MSTESKLKYRGVIEGFYGPMWSHEERLYLVRHLRGWNMNLYIFSPRNDPYTRTRWDAPYPPDEMQRLRELAEEAARHEVMFSFGISPGTDFDPDRPAHREALLAKLQPFIELGCTFFPILYDAHGAGSLRLAVLLQQLAPPQHALARRFDLVFGNHPLDDAEALDPQRLQVTLDLGVAAFGDAGADGVGDAETLVEN